MEKTSTDVKATAGFLGGLTSKLWKDRSTKGKVGVVVVAFMLLGTLGSVVDNPDSGIESATLAEPLNPADAESANTAEPAKPAEISVTTDTAESAQPAETSTTTETAESRKPAEISETTFAADSQGLDEFLSIIDEHVAQYRAAGTDLQRADLRLRRDEALCAAFPSRQVTAWLGVVDDVRGNSDGDAQINVEVARHINLRTLSTRFTDRRYGTMIDRTDPLYPTLVSLNKGDEVLFSGEFLRDSDSCLFTTNLTETFGMSRPDFVFRFTSISKR